MVYLTESTIPEYSDTPVIFARPYLIPKFTNSYAESVLTVNAKSSGYTTSKHSLGSLSLSTVSYRIFHSKGCMTNPWIISCVIPILPSQSSIVSHQNNSQSYNISDIHLDQFLSFWGSPVTMPKCWMHSSINKYGRIFSFINTPLHLLCHIYG